MKPFIPREWIRMRKQPDPTAILDHVDQFGTAVFTDGKCVYAPYSPGEVCWVREKLYRDMYWAMYEDRTPALNSAGIQIRWEWKKREILPAAFMPKEAARRHVRILSCVPEQRGEWGWRIEWEESNAL